LDGRDNQHSALNAQARTLAYEFEVIVERLPPASALPRDGPAFPARLTADDSLRDHPRLFYGPGRHGLPALGVLGNHCLEHHEPEPGFAGLLHLRKSHRKLARRFAPRVLQRETRVRSSYVKLIGIEQVLLEVPRQAAGVEAYEVFANLKAKRGRDVR